MDELFAKNFDIVKSYDVIGGKPLHIIELTGIDGHISVYGIKKTTCRIEEKTLQEAKKHCNEIIEFTRKDRSIERKLYEESLGYEVEYDEHGDEIPRYTATGKDRQVRNSEGDYDPVYADDKVVLRFDKAGEIIPKYDYEGNEIPFDKRPEVVSYLAEQESLRLEAEEAEKNEEDGE